MQRQARVPATRQGAQKPAAWYADRSRWRLIALEILGTAAVLVVYFFIRGVRPDSVDNSVARSLVIVRFEQQLGIFHEAQWQEMFVSSKVLMTIANVIYAWLHYVVLLSIALWLVIKDPKRFRFIRNVMMVSAIIGIFCYWVLPAAPPRLMEPNGYDLGFIDTVHGATSNVHYFQPGPFVNDYAAVPSFHFGWMALASTAIWVNTQRRWLKVMAVGLSIVMWWAVTVTGNHYFFDMIMGGAVVGFAWLFVATLEETRVRRLALSVRDWLLPREPDFQPNREWREFDPSDERANGNPTIQI